jgi:acetyl-CoA hydrolase
MEYLEKAEKKTGYAHEPQILSECYKMYVNLEENSTMRFWNK